MPFHSQHQRLQENCQRGEILLFPRGLKPWFATLAWCETRKIAKRCACFARNANSYFRTCAKQGNAFGTCLQRTVRSNASLACFASRSLFSQARSFLAWHCAKQCKATLGNSCEFRYFLFFLGACSAQCQASTGAKIAELATCAIFARKHQPLPCNPTLAVPRNAFGAKLAVGVCVRIQHACLVLFSHQFPTAIPLLCTARVVLGNCFAPRACFARIRTNLNFKFTQEVWIFIFNTRQTKTLKNYNWFSYD